MEKPAKLDDMPEAWIGRYGPGKILIPDPRDLRDLINLIEPGTVKRMGELRDVLAERAGAAATCPLCAGLFHRIVAEAAEEDRAEGLPVSPYWRLVKDDGSLNPKLPGGVEAQAAMLRTEGVEVVPKGKSGMKVRL